MYRLIDFAAEAILPCGRSIPIGLAFPPADDGSDINLCANLTFCLQKINVKDSILRLFLDLGLFDAPRRLVSLAWNSSSRDFVCQALIQRFLSGLSVGFLSGKPFVEI
jgi:hypothetical protein